MSLAMVFQPSLQNYNEPWGFESFQWRFFRSSTLRIKEQLVGAKRERPGEDLQNVPEHFMITKYQSGPNSSLLSIPHGAGFPQGRTMQVNKRINSSLHPPSKMQR